MFILSLFLIAGTAEGKSGEVKTWFSVVDINIVVSVVFSGAGTVQGKSGEVKAWFSVGDINILVAVVLGGFELGIVELLVTCSMTFVMGLRFWFVLSKEPENL